MKTRPVFFIGESGAHLQEALAALDRRLEFDSLPSLCTTQSFKPSAADSGRLHLPQCPSNCMICWDQLCLHCCQSRKDAHKAMRRAVEQLDYLSSVSIVGGASSPFERWAWSQTLENLRDDYGRLAIHSTVLRPYLGDCGVNAYYSVLATTQILDHCTSIMIRGSEDFLFEDEIDQARKTSGAARELSLRDYYHWLACDMWCVLAPHNDAGRYMLWPQHICSYPQRLYDVRTSLHRTLQKLAAAAKGSRKGIDVAPARFVSTALHRLHLCYQQRFPAPFPLLSETVRMASSTLMRLDSVRQRILFQAPQSETQVGVHWASPGLRWMLYEDLCDHYLATPPVASLDSHDAKPVSVLGNIPIAALAFQSPYATLDLLSLLRRVQGLLTARAFEHVVSDTTGGTMESVLDAAYALEAFLGDVAAASV